MINRVIIGASEHRKKMCNIDGTVVVVSGYDKPMFIDTRTGVSGKLGMEDWFNYWNKPVGLLAEGGELESGKWYSAVVVAECEYVVSRLGDIRRSNPTMAADPIQCSADQKKILWSVPQHSQFDFVYIGKSLSSSSGYVFDDNLHYADNALIGFRLVNHATGQWWLITGNSGDRIYADGASFSYGDTYAVMRSACTRRAVFASVGSTREAAAAGPFIFQGYVNNNDAHTFEMSKFAETGYSPQDDSDEPPCGSSVSSANGMLIIGGGVVAGCGNVSILRKGDTYEGEASISIVHSDILDKSYVVARIESQSELFAGDLIGGEFVELSGFQASGNNGTFKVVRADTNRKWIEYINKNSVAESASSGVSVTVDRNSVTSTNRVFYDGFVGGTVILNGVVAGKVDSVSRDGKSITLSELIGVSFTGDISCVVKTYVPIYASKPLMPHVFSDNFIDIQDAVTGIVYWNNMLIILCMDSVWRCQIDQNGSLLVPALVSDTMGCKSNFGYCVTSRGVAFFNGSGLSITDGVSATDVTRHKVGKYVNVDKSKFGLVTCVYDNIRNAVYMAFPRLGDEYCNYGLIVHMDTFDCFQLQCPDMSMLFYGTSADGKKHVMFSTSPENGQAKIRMFTDDSQVDVSEISGTVLIIGQLLDDGKKASFAVYSGVNQSGGSYYCINATAVTRNGVMREIIIKEISFATKTCEMSDGYSLDDVYAGGFLVIGAIPFVYGIKWTDFSSPQYHHQIRELQIDVRNFSGRLIVEHFINMIDSAKQVDDVMVDANTTKVTIPVKIGSCHQYGYRIRGYSFTRFEIVTFNIVHDTQV